MSAVGEVRVLPAAVFDALELSAEAFGGIGAYRLDDMDGSPYCIWGHADFVAESDVFEPSPVERALEACDITVSASDLAVRDINVRRDVYGGARVPFADWCTALGVIRGSQ